MAGLRPKPSPCHQVAQNSSWQTSTLEFFSHKLLSPSCLGWTELRTLSTLVPYHNILKLSFNTTSYSVFITSFPDQTVLPCMVTWLHGYTLLYSRFIFYKFYNVQNVSILTCIRLCLNCMFEIMCIQSIESYHILSSTCGLLSIPYLQSSVLSGSSTVIASNVNFLLINFDGNILYRLY